MSKKSFGVSLPEEVVARVDAEAALWHTDRSAILTRIIMEWINLKDNLTPAYPQAKLAN